MKQNPIQRISRHRGVLLNDRLTRTWRTATACNAGCCAWCGSSDEIRGTDLFTSRLCYSALLLLVRMPSAVKGMYVAGEHPLGLLTDEHYSPIKHSFRPFKSQKAASSSILRRIFANPKAVLNALFKRLWDFGSNFDHRTRKIKRFVRFEEFDAGEMNLSERKKITKAFAYF